MRRSTPRNVVAAAVLAVFLLPAGFVAALWNFLGALLPGTGGPPAATASACDNRWGIDPNGGTACATSDNHWGIDPNG